jgi:hypothetical protein
MFSPANLDGVLVLPHNVATMEGRGWFTDREAARKAVAASQADPAKPAKLAPKSSRPKDKAKRIETIRVAMFKIDPENSGQVTEGGKPEVKALEIILGWAPTASERDEAFALQTK